MRPSGLEVLGDSTPSGTAAASASEGGLSLDREIDHMLAQYAQRGPQIAQHARRPAEVESEDGGSVVGEGGGDARARLQVGFCKLVETGIVQWATGSKRCPGGRARHHNTLPLT
jgi:hypothetical protein